jgi:hypothetical protein
MPAACARASNRLRLAQEGGRQALGVLTDVAIASEVSRIIDWMDLQGGREAMYLERLKSTEAQLDHVAAYYEGQPIRSDDVHRAIDNVNAFRRLVKETRMQLAANGCGSE